ncbi:MAG: hypothetical protein HY960_13665 [Ignavibacteriae bacterium]|nr:hypothetical protein [Ignavibacteriota bacterium]
MKYVLSQQFERTDKQKVVSFLLLSLLTTIMSTFNVWANNVLSNHSSFIKSERMNSTSQSMFIDSFTIRVKPGWNLISIPFFPDEPCLRNIFSSSKSTAFFYNGKSYFPYDSIISGKAFWMKFSAEDSFTMYGQKQFEEEIFLHPQWNLISGTRKASATSGLMFSSDTLLATGFYGYNTDTGYSLTDTLQSGNGYWVKATTTGKIMTTQWEYLGLDGERISSIAIHPQNPNIVYCGSLSDFSSGVPGKLFKSTNEGFDWDTVLIGGYFKQIEFDVVHPETIYVVNDFILKSTDGGTTWARRDSGIYIDWETFVSCLAIHPTNRDVLYAGTAGFYGGKFYKSTNGGLSWQDVTTNDTLRDGVTVIRIDDTNPNTMYVGTGWSGTLLKTTNAGTTWSTTGFKPNGWIINDVFIHPVRTNELVLATYDTAFYRSSDAGVTWYPYDAGLPHNYPPSPELPDTIVVGTKLIFDKEKDIILGLFGQGQTDPPYHLGTDRGIYVFPHDNSPWYKIRFHTISAFGEVDINLSPNTGFLYLGGMAMYRLKYK